MFITVAPVAAPKPHAISLTSSATECQTSKPQTEAERIGELLAKLVFDGNVRSMEALAQVIVASDWGQISAVAAVVTLHLRPCEDTELPRRSSSTAQT